MQQVEARAKVAHRCRHASSFSLQAGFAVSASVPQPWAADLAGEHWRPARVLAGNEIGATLEGGNGCE